MKRFRFFWWACLLALSIGCSDDSGDTGGTAGEGGIGGAAGEGGIGGSAGEGGTGGTAGEGGTGGTAGEGGAGGAAGEGGAGGAAGEGGAGGQGGGFAVACNTDSDCVKTGCGGEICAAEEVATDCSQLPEGECYWRDPIANCGCNEGICTFQDPEAVAECIEEIRSGTCGTHLHQFCDPLSGCPAGFRCGETNECTSSHCGCDPETGDIICLPDCMPEGTRLCEPCPEGEPCEDVVVDEMCNHMDDDRDGMSDEGIDCRGILCYEDESPTIQFGRGTGADFEAVTDQDPIRLVFGPQGAHMIEGIIASEGIPQRAVAHITVTDGITTLTGGGPSQMTDGIGGGAGGEVFFNCDAGWHYGYIGIEIRGGDPFNLVGVEGTLTIRVTDMQDNELTTLSRTALIEVD